MLMLFVVNYVKLHLTALLLLLLLLLFNKLSLLVRELMQNINMKYNINLISDFNMVYNHTWEQNYI